MHPRIHPRNRTVRLDDTLIVKGHDAILKMSQRMFPSYISHPIDPEIAFRPLNTLSHSVCGLPNCSCCPPLCLSAPPVVYGFPKLLGVSVHTLQRRQRDFRRNPTRDDEERIVPLRSPRIGRSSDAALDQSYPSVRAGKSCSALTNAKNGRCYFFDEM